MIEQYKGITGIREMIFLNQWRCLNDFSTSQITGSEYQPFNGVKHERCLSFSLNDGFQSNENNIVYDRIIKTFANVARITCRNKRMKR